MTDRDNIPDAVLTNVKDGLAWIDVPDRIPHWGTNRLITEEMKRRIFDLLDAIFTFRWPEIEALRRQLTPAQRRNLDVFDDCVINQTRGPDIPWERAIQLRDLLGKETDTARKKAMAMRDAKRLPPELLRHIEWQESLLRAYRRTTSVIVDWPAFDHPNYLEAVASLRAAVTDNLDQVTAFLDALASVDTEARVLVSRRLHAQRTY